MTQHVTVQLKAPVQEVGVVGPSNSLIPPQILRELKAELKTEYERKYQQIQRQHQQKLQELHQAGEALQTAMRELETARMEMQIELETNALDLAMDIARRITMREVQTGQYDIDAILREALLLLPQRGQIVVHLNGDDLQRCGLTESLEEQESCQVRFVADSKIPPAGCLVESLEGSVELSPELSLDRTHQALKAQE
jgi:flagellar biosynthesis/type III secretory pathway protein FliH